MAEHHKLMAHLLLTLYSHGPMRMGELLPAFTERTGRRPHRATMHRWLVKMERWGLVRRTGKLGVSVKWGLTDYARFLIALNKPALLPSEALIFIRYAVMDAALRYCRGEIDKDTLIARLKSHLFYTLPRVLVLGAACQDERFFPSLQALLSALGNILSSSKTSMLTFIRTVQEELRTEALDVAVEPRLTVWPPEAAIREEREAPDEEFDEFLRALRSVLAEAEESGPPDKWT